MVCSSFAYEWLARFQELDKNQKGYQTRRSDIVQGLSLLFHLQHFGEVFLMRTNIILHQFPLCVENYNSRVGNL